jgi:hypothetical protein
MEADEHVSKRAKTRTGQTSSLDKSRTEATDDILRISHIIWTIVLPVTKTKPTPALGEALFPLLTLIAKEYLRKHDWRTQLLLVCENGFTKTAKWMVDKYSFKKDDIRMWHEQAFGCACKNGHLEMAMWMADRFYLTAADARADNNYALSRSAYKGQFSVVKWLYTKFGLTSGDILSDVCFTFRYACIEGHLEIAKWLWSKARIPIDKLLPELISNTSRTKHPEVVRWLAQTFCNEWIHIYSSEHLNEYSIMMGLVAANDTREYECMRFLMPLRRSLGVNALAACCEAGNADAAQWLFTVAFSTRLISHRDFCKETFRYCCQRGHLSAVKWLDDTFKFGELAIIDGEYNCLKAACDGGYIDIVKLLIDRLGKDYFITNRLTIVLAFILTCCRGHLELAKYLHELFLFTVEDIKSLRMTIGTSISRHLDMLKWMVKTFELDIEFIRDIGLLENACSSNSITTVRWILSNFAMTADDLHRKPYGTYDYMCAEGQYASVRLLHAHFNVVNNENARRYFLETLKHANPTEGNLRVAKWLVRTFTFDKTVTFDILNELCKYGRADLVEWIIANNLFCDLSEADRVTCFLSACKCGSIYIARLLRSTFTQSACDKNLAKEAIRVSTQEGYNQSRCAEADYYLISEFKISHEELLKDVKFTPGQLVYFDKLYSL